MNYSEAALENKNLCKIVHLELINRGIFLAPRGMMALSTPMDENVIDILADAFKDTLISVSRVM